MTLLKKIPFMFEEKNFEIRILFGDNMVNIVAFYNNHPANGYRHQIKILKNFDPEKLLETETFKELVEISRNDILQKRWEKLVKTFKVK